ncbi:MAG: aspartate carbamoyltransferase, partial [Anaerolineales bacterium]
MILQEKNTHSSPHLPFGDQRTAPWYGKSILSVKQFSEKDLKYIFEVAHEMREMVERIGTFDLLKGKILANLFYEPSTRTASSFTAAMERLGGSVIPINEVKYSSVAKGESLPDTIRSLECYSDVIVLRHPEVGASALAAQYARKPIINAGDGIGEHPTQALLDLFTIIEEKGLVDGLSVTLLGDLKYGRTVHSLSRLLSLYNVRLNFISPEILSLPREIITELEEKGIPYLELRMLEEILPETDVLYVTRVQKERFEDVKEYEKVKCTYIITP